MTGTRYPRCKRWTVQEIHACLQALSDDVLLSNLAEQEFEVGQQQSALANCMLPLYERAALSTLRRGALMALLHMHGFIVNRCCMHFHTPAPCMKRVPGCLLTTQALPCSKVQVGHTSQSQCRSVFPPAPLGFLTLGASTPRPRTITWLHLTLCNLFASEMSMELQRSPHH